MHVRLESDFANAIFGMALTSNFEQRCVFPNSQRANGLKAGISRDGAAKQAPRNFFLERGIYRSTPTDFERGQSFIMGPRSIGDPLQMPRERWAHFFLRW